MNKNIYNPQDHAEAVTEIHDFLLHEGALDVVEGFSIANEDQHDIVLDQHRYLVTPNNDQLNNYQNAMNDAGQPTLERSELLSVLHPLVAVFEIPRDARNLDQVAVSTDAENITNETVYGMLGRTIGELAARSHVIPEPFSFNVHRVLYSRIKDEVILPPGTELLPYSHKADYAIEASVRNQLLPQYKKFGGMAMLGAFLAEKHK
jgi:hypothetical protein